MDKVIEADQGRPYKLMKNRFLHTTEYKELLCIVKRNIPNITTDEIIKMFKSMSDSGCSAAMLANLLATEFYKDEESFKNMFGFSISSKGTLNYNKILVDIYSKLYGVMKVKFIEYNTYTFKSIKEAALNLLGKEYSDDTKASIDLFNNGIQSDGIDSNGNLIFKSREPKITTCVGTASEIAKEKFGVEASFDELKKICSNRNIKIECSDIEIYEKLTGLTSNNFNFWSNYYLSKSHIDYTLESKQVAASDFNGDYYSFMEHLNGLILDGYEVSVSAGPKSKAQMHTKGKLSWGPISSDNAGHVMLLKGFDEKQDIIVASYGQDYIIPKEFFTELEFKKIKASPKEELENQKKV